MPPTPDPASDPPANPQFAFAELVPHMVWVARPDGSAEYVNRRWREYTGMTLAEVAARGWAETTHPDDLEAAGVGWFVAVRSGEPYEVAFRFRRHDGAYRWHVSRGQPEPDAAGSVVRVVGTCTDVDNQRRAEDLVRTSEAQYRLLFEANPHPMWVFDPVTFRFLAVNAAATARYGYARDEFLGMTIADIRPPEDVAPALDCARQAAGWNSGRMWRHQWRDGTIRQVEITAHDIRYGGRPARLVVALDVTDRLRAENALREREQLLRGVIANIPGGVFWKDRDSVYLGCNDLFARNHGLPGPDAVVGKTDVELGTTPAEAGAFRAADRRVVEAGEPVLDVEEVLTRPDGARLALLTSKVPLRDAAGGVVGVLGVYQDVTDRRRAEALQARLAGIVASSDDAIIGLTPAGVVETWNPGAERLYGYAEEEAVGRSVAFLLPPDRASDLPDLTERLARGEHVPPFETVRLRKDGTRVEVSLRLSPQIDAAGRLTGYSAIARDITERRRLEAQLRQAAKMEAVGRLAGGVAHDFNNLLTVINGFSELALEALPADAAARPLVEQVRKAGDRAAALTRQLLAYGRKQILHPQTLDLGALVTDLGAMLRRLIGEDIALTLDPAPVRVVADPGQVSQVVLNLAVNARDAMPRGGRLTVRTVSRPLPAGVTADGGAIRAGRYAVLEVADTGVGMPDEVKARAFEPFFTTKGIGEGTGLGLAMVYGIVTQSGGHVVLDSAVGRGTTFRVCFPAVESAGPASGERQLPVAPARGTERVLLVEDDDRVRALAAHVLRAAGYDVVEAATGERALAEVEAREPAVDVLVTDVVMPGMGGRELADRLSAARPGLRVLFTSGYTDDAVVRNGVEQDAVQFLQKPYTPAVLVAKMREVLDAAD